MDNKKDDKTYINKAIEHIDVILSYTKNLSEDEFLNDVKLIDAILFRLIQIQENLSHLSESFKKKNSQIPWGSIAGFRNGVVHNYGKTDFKRVFDIVNIDLLPLKKLLLKL